MARLYICAGEPSADRLGAEIVSELRRRRHDLLYRGVAGPLMRDVGVTAAHKSEAATTLGLVEALVRIPDLLDLARRIEDDLLSWKPDLLLTIDSPSLLLRIGRFARRRGIRVVHTVSPQLWAWRPGRAARVAQSCDTLLCLLPFEPALYDGTGLDARFVGHPAAARAPAGTPSGDPPVIALLPGSRPQEVAAHWPLFRRVAGD